MIIDIILLWIVNRICAMQEQKEVKKRSYTAKEEEELAAFFFGTHPLEREDRSKQVNNNYDQGPNW